MSPETEQCMSECLRLSQKINGREFNTIQKGMWLIELETLLLQKLAQKVTDDLRNYHPRYFDDPDFHQRFYDDDDDDLALV